MTHAPSEITHSHDTVIILRETSSEAISSAQNPRATFSIPVYLYPGQFWVLYSSISFQSTVATAQNLHYQDSLLLHCYQLHCNSLLYSSFFCFFCCFCLGSFSFKNFRL